MSNSEQSSASNFLQQIISDDLAAGRNEGRVQTRFPPEPNGYLHIGHAKSICVNFGLAEQFGGQCNLRFDDTNPEKEEQEYIDAIQEDVRWLGFQWSGEVRYASSYFEQFYQWALHLIREGDAYVCDLSPEQASEYRGWATKPGKESPYRQRSVEENLALFEKMRAGEFAEGACVLRAKIDMASPNMNLRDPILYRIRKESHHQTGDAWCIYPSYDFAHGQEDAIEGVTHSICTLEFQDHRPLYDWFLEHLPVPNRPRQYEFARLNLNYTVTSKRKLKRLVDEGVVAGWDDPRMPTISGMRRRGYTPAALRKFCDMIGTNRSDGVVDMGMLEFALREDLNDTAARAMCVLRPLKVVITNMGVDAVEMVSAPVHPNNGEMGARSIPFTAELYIDEEDFTEDTSLSRKKFKRLVLGDYVRLRSAYVIRADEVVRDETGVILEVRASLVPGTVGENPPEEIRPRGVIHWVSATEGKPARVRLYDRLFNHEAPDRGDQDFMEHLNPHSLEVIENCWVEPSVASAAPETRFQFEREGYFCIDRYESSPDALVINRTIGLKDTWDRKEGA
ncbi:glutamine--tRNA ligase/YqeY domain fusion protein [Aestuariirhabdus litorea]|uniref:Glutamine--tRNA ligase n=1 Tax=Aestuariirhabdus litorea TaxID=2528527 RepID=A0A3P3VSG0_9GAMM|nr:glutamine--tRNA ligase/YqeY domain fusion protein [Aestuariirhabdus litorea]RRJ84908.1 glutamine--tRNA ligase/YqeY domain fusion protein [Aestuariirhabdus litorea]RWW98134.1 glutamine--tRNA ligase/YqeY domain fusion protein [Endozoicomonadaceae bacterium GTF-13]